MCKCPVFAPVPVKYICKELCFKSETKATHATKHADGHVKKNNINCSPTPPWAVVLRHDGSATSEDFFTKYTSNGVLQDKGDPTTKTGMFGRTFAASVFDYY